MKTPIQTGSLFCASLLLAAVASAQEVIHVAPDGGSTATGSAADPCDFERALALLAARNEAGQDLPGGIEIRVHAGRYRVQHPWVLGPSHSGREGSPTVLRAADGAAVVFDGAIPIPAASFAPVRDAEERARLAASAADRILVTELKDPELIRALSDRVTTTLSIDGAMLQPSVFPNEGYAGFERDLVVPEVTPPAIKPGAQGYGIRAGNPPFQEEGKPQGWLGSIDEPRGGWARIGRGADQMAGRWEQWQAELARNPRRCVLTGYIEANWLRRSQAVVGADAEKRAIHLSQALAYGWQWKQGDKPYRIFGLLCELDQPGEWHFDPLTNRLYLFPPDGFGPESVVGLPAAQGFLTLRDAHHVQILGLHVENLGGGYAYAIESGHHNLIGGATIRSGPYGGVSVKGDHNRVQACDLIDLQRHVALGGGRRGPGVLERGDNLVANCHIYQQSFDHLGVNVSISGVGNSFRNNLVHNSIGQAVVVRGNDLVLEFNEFFNIGYDEGDGGAVYSGADLAGYGNLYRYNFFHHLMHVPGKVERSGIHLDDCQAGATCIGNVFYKSAAKGIFMFGGAGHTLRDNVFLEGYRGIYNVGTLGARHYQWEQEIAADPNHRYRNTKENYLGRLEKTIGPEGWLQEPWASRYPRMVEVLEDRGRFGRMWPIRCVVENNLYFGNSQGDHLIWSRMDPEVQAKSILRGERVIGPEVFVDYAAMDFRFRSDDLSLPFLPFDRIGLMRTPLRPRVPDKTAYRRAVRAFFDGISSMPGTRKHLDSAALLNSVPQIGAQ